MAYNNPVSMEDPRPNIGLDQVLNSLVSDFNGILWLEDKVFLRAYEIKTEGVDGKLTTEPQVYMGNGEYYPVLYNDNIPCSMFFRSDGDESIVFNKAIGARIITQSRPMSLIFWGIMTRIDEYPGDYIFSEALKRDFFTVLGKNQYVREISRFVDDPLDRVFEGYTIAEEKRHLSRYPYIAVRIDFIVEYKTPVTPC